MVKKSLSFFQKKERDNRLQAIRSLMEEQKLDGILFTSFHNINYFDHFLYTAFGRNYGLVVTRDRICSVTANIDGG